MGFEPHADEHAIESCEFALRIEPAFHAGMLTAAQDVWSELKNELPAEFVIPSSEAAEGTIVRSNNIVHPQSLKYAYLRPDGSPVWELIIGNSEIRIGCSRYTRWENVWSFVEFVWMTLLSGIAERIEQDVAVYGIALRVVDLFVDDDVTNNADEVLDFSTERLPPNLRLKTGSWHMNQGWFEERKAGRVLVNFNMNLVIGSDSLNPSLIRIEHLQHTLISEPIFCNNNTKGDIKNVSDVMEVMHKENKKILSDVLNESIASRINLYGKGADGE